MSLLASRQEDQFRDLQSAMIARLTDTIKDQISALPKWPQTIERTQQKMRTDSTAIISSRYKQPEKSAFRNVDTSTDDYTVYAPSVNQDTFVDAYVVDFAIKLAEMEEQQWESLHFPVINDREEQIVSAELKTFDWILQPPQGHDRHWDSFVEWLEGAGALYWINGKAGSGKSTLMKYLKGHSKVQDALSSWSGDTPLIVAAFFFWYNGNALQRSQEGLLRSLLYQALDYHRELIPIVLSDVGNVSTIELESYWTLPRLSCAFKKLVEQKEIPLRVCLLIDGLDEYSGDHSEIAEVFRYASKFEHIKVCVSSRPLLPFDRSFKDFPGLMLQNLTFNDIQTYVESKFDADERFRELQIEEPKLGSDLALQVVNKAAGVFLWVKLVVHSLLEGIQNYDRGVDLERRLDELPEDLDDLYWHMLDRVKPAWYLEEGFRLILLAHAAVAPLPLLQFAFVNLDSSAQTTESGSQDMSLERQNALCKSMSGRIKSRCLGLLEVTDLVCKDEKYRRVQFLHKSVKDFVDTPRLAKRMQDILCKNKPFIPELAIMESCLARLRTVKPRLNSHQVCVGGGLTREAWFEEVRVVVLEALVYGTKFHQKYPKARHLYGPVITQVDGIATQLWNEVQFKSTEEIDGSQHWSTAPRKPGGAIAGDVDLDALDSTSRDSENEREEDIISKYIQFENTPGFIARPRTSQVRFSGIPAPHCFPGEPEEYWRPGRALVNIHALDFNLRPEGLEHDRQNRGFEGFVRVLGLQQYADERFGPTSSSDGIRLAVPKANSPKAAQRQRSSPSQKSRSLWKRLKSVAGRWEK